MMASPYLHVLEGRIRIKIPEVKRSRVHARRVEILLKNLDGIDHVEANHVTGNVLILFDSEVLSTFGIFDYLKRHRYLREESTHAQSGHPLMRFLVQSATEAALERMILALL